MMLPPTQDFGLAQLRGETESAPYRHSMDDTDLATLLDSPIVINSSPRYLENETTGSISDSEISKSVVISNQRKEELHSGKSQHPGTLSITPSLLPYRLDIIQQWECTIIDVQSDIFIARMRDVGEPSNPLEEAEFPLDAVSKSDLPLVEQGCVFYWSMGYKTLNTGSRELVSSIRFRRLPRIGQLDIRFAKKSAKRLFSEFGKAD